MQTPEYKFNKFRQRSSEEQHSFEQIEKPSSEDYQTVHQLPQREKAAISGLQAGQAPQVIKGKGSFWGQLGKFCSNLFGQEETREAANSVPSKRGRKASANASRDNNQSQRDGQSLRHSNQRRGGHNRQRQNGYRGDQGRVRTAKAAEPLERTLAPTQNAAPKSTPQKPVRNQENKAENKAVVQPVVEKPEVNTVVKTVEASQSKTPKAKPLMSTHPDLIESLQSTKESAIIEIAYELKAKKTSLTKPALKTLMAEIEAKQGNANLIESKLKAKTKHDLAYEEVVI